MTKIKLPKTRTAASINAASGLLGAPPTPTPGAPAKGNPVVPGVQPPDPAFESTRLAANRNVAVTNGAAAYDTGNLNFDYGYNTDGSINTANPYSRAALYMKQYEASKRGTTTGMASQGQLHSGAYQRAQGYNDSNYAQAEAANRLAYQRGLHGIQSGRLGALANAGTGVSDADFSALLRATYPGS